MAKQHILVTGGAGYIGSHTCKVLAQAGLEPVVVDNLIFGHRDLVRWGAFEEGDLRDSAFLDRVFQTYQPVAVIHFAGYTYVGESVTDPAKFYANNVVAAMSLLDAMRRAGCAVFIFSSTCSVFGMPDQLPLSEKHPQAPISPYGQTKLVVEKMLADYERAYGIKHVVLRYFNAAGADPEGECGEDHDPETHLIPLALFTLMGRRNLLKIFGTDYPTEDGTAVRDYIHVMDLAEAHLLALRHLLEGGQSDAFNLGTGQGYSVRKIIQVAEAVTGLTMAVEEAPRREGDPPVLVSDSSHIFQDLGWKPRYSDIQSLVETAWRWHQNRHG
ncbi:MAG: UDP-glucose 4-epimerase GalE [Magnetococcales bacterium]|nr:UDP-glucose 4-epimerase GalE [Magnetococcales bacterium]